MNTSQKIATILLKGGIAPLTEIAPQCSYPPLRYSSSLHGIAPLMEIAPQGSYPPLR